MHSIALTFLSLIAFSLASTTLSETFSMQNDTAKVNDSLLRSVVNDTSKTNYSAESEMVQNLLFGSYEDDFTLIDFLESLQPSYCLQVCMNEVVNMLKQPFAGQSSTDDAGNICSHFDVFQRCLYHDRICKDALLNITTTIIDHICNFNKRAFEGIFPCVLSHSTTAYVTCNDQCKMEEILAKALKEKQNDLTNIIDENDSEAFKIPNFHGLCRASACFINCTQHIIEKECPIGPSTLLHKIVAAVVDYSIKMIPISEIKSIDAYTLLVSSILPNECQRLKLLSQINSFETANSEENNINRTVLNSNAENQTKSVYTEILQVNGRQIRLQCQMTDLETGQVKDMAKLMSTGAWNISNVLRLRSVENERILENNAKFEAISGLESHEATGYKNK